MLLARVVENEILHAQMYRVRENASPFHHNASFMVNSTPKQDNRTSGPEVRDVAAHGTYYPKNLTAEPKPFYNDPKAHQVKMSETKQSLQRFVHTSS